jgi:hypothetical protein
VHKRSIHAIFQTLLLRKPHEYCAYAFDEDEMLSRQGRKDNATFNQIFVALLRVLSGFAFIFYIRKRNIHALFQAKMAEKAHKYCA